MEYFACPKCKGREFLRLEVVSVDSKGIALGVESSGIFRCNGCNTRVSIEAATGVIAVVEVSAKSTQAQKPVTVRSSVSASERGISERKF